MNNSYLLLAVGVVAAALGLMLLFGQPAPVSAPEAPEAVAAESQVAPETDATPIQYWQPVSESAKEIGPTSKTAAYGVEADAPCGYCGAIHDIGETLSGDAVKEAPAREFLVGGCGSPVSPCGRSTCEQSACQRLTLTCPRPTTQPSAGGCGTPVAPCAERSCEWPTHTCGTSCATPCGERPGINRNVATCVDECGFVQLHSTARQPICSAVRFEWAASRGSFLDPTASDPLYFTPTVHQPGGEDVVITLTITDALGARYSDHMRLRVRNVR